MDTSGETAPWEEGRVVALAQSGNAWAMEELVRRYQKKAYAIAYHLSEGEPQDAEDLTQEAFLRAFKNLRKFRGKSTFYTWFYRILVNVCLDRRRHRNRWQLLVSPWASRKHEKGRTLVEAEDVEGRQDPVRELNNRQLSKDIETAMKALPEKQRVAFQLKVLHGMSISQIAEVTGAAEGTVKSHLFRATHSLRQALKSWEE
jgi:RNA polymerase sigma-70 factor (ECF subfamily)